MRVLVCGSRTFEARDAVYAALFGWSALRADDPQFVVIEGQCPYGGADKHAEDWAKEFGYKHLPFPAEWDKYGKAAGPIRNQRMLDDGKPDLVLAFVDKPLAQSRGTSDMVAKARYAGIPTYVTMDI